MNDNRRRLLNSGGGDVKIFCAGCPKCYKFYYKSTYTNGLTTTYSFVPCTRIEVQLGNMYGGTIEGTTLSGKTITKGFPWNSSTQRATISTTPDDYFVSALFTPGAVDDYDTSYGWGMYTNLELKELEVDLGLPSGIKWATSDLAVTCLTQEENDNDSYTECGLGYYGSLGAFFQWAYSKPFTKPAGSTNGKQGYKTTDINPEDVSQDAARYWLGEPWRMPTKAEFLELYNYCDLEYVNGSSIYPDIDGMSTSDGAYKFMKKDDHSVYILFPATAWYFNNGNLIWDDYGRVSYWTSTYYGRNGYGYTANFGRYKQSGYTYWKKDISYMYCKAGHHIRPVHD